MPIYMKALALCLILIHLPALAQLDEHQTKGLEDTKEMLVNPAQRKEAIKGDKKALEMDAKVDALAGSSENKEEIYSIAAQVMDKITAECKGEPTCMQKLLLGAQADPKAFHDKYFDKTQQDRVRGVANKIERKKGSSLPRK